MRTMYDAAYPPPDPHLDVCAFYIGVTGNTPHVWNDEDITAQSARWRLPIVTRVNAQGSAQAQADAALAAAWMSARRVPLGSAVALDFEAQVNAVYVRAFDAYVTAHGYTALLYGQASTVYDNPRPSAGYWSGQWTDVAHLDSRDSATQWASDQMLGKPYDLSEVSDTLLLWDTRPPAPKPVPPPKPKEPDMIMVTGFSGTDVWLLAPPLYKHIQDGPSVTGYQAAGVQTATITAAEHADNVTKVAALAASITVPVTVDTAQLAVAIKAAFTDPGLLAAQGAAIAHAEAVQEHIDTPSS